MPYFFLIYSDLSHSFSDFTGFLLFLDLASEAQEAQAARLFLFSCREALFSPAFLTCSFLFYFVSLPDLCLHAIRRAFTWHLLVLPLYFPFFPLVILMNPQIGMNKRLVQEKDQQPILRQGMVDADLEASPSTQVRLASSFYSLSILAGDLFFTFFPVLAQCPKTDFIFFAVLDNRWIRRQR